MKTLNSYQNTSPYKRDSNIFDQYNEVLSKTQKKVDSVPYERFPFCCSANNSIKQDVDLARKRNVVPIKK